LPKKFRHEGNIEKKLPSGEAWPSTVIIFGRLSMAALTISLLFGVIALLSSISPWSIPSILS
jgi:hypothetical protein